ncbi:MAG TPA: hypothetical protein VKU01_07225 [Bryobacteraceae bacterium]|nr:hypothetical protein [Bryobacteraceae bacterium]
MRKTVVIEHCDSPADKPLAQRIQVRSRKRRMRLPCGSKVALDADVQLLDAALEPASAPCTQQFGFLDLAHSQEQPVEAPGRLFAARRRCYLDVVDPFNEP